MKIIHGQLHPPRHFCYFQNYTREVAWIPILTYEQDSLKWKSRGLNYFLRKNVPSKGARSISLGCSNCIPQLCPRLGTQVLSKDCLCYCVFPQRLVLLTEMPRRNIYFNIKAGGKPCGQARGNSINLLTGKRRRRGNKRGRMGAGAELRSCPHPHPLLELEQCVGLRFSSRV